jgi:predicted transcriptional regulator
MEVVWQGGSVTVRDVQGRLARSIAYTTVMTTLDRLFKKGFVQRTRDGRAFRYSAAHSRQQVEAAVATGLLTGFLQHGNGAARPLLSNLVDVVAERDEALLDELAALVREKQRGAGARAKRSQKRR